MARLLSTATVLALRAATAVAFALTERAKLEHSPIYGTHVDPIFSPAGKTNKVAHIDFRVRTRERVDVWIQDAKGQNVDSILVNRPVRARTKLDLVWNGVTESGLLVPDGAYMPVVKLLRSHRTIRLPNEIRLDTTPPKISVKHPQYPILSPDGDGQRDVFRFHYTIDERAHAILLVRGTQALFTKTQKPVGSLTWNGKLDGTPVRPGRYLLAIAAQDIAGNVSKGVPFAIVQVRYVVLARERVVVKPGGAFALRVSTDHPTVRWTLHGRSGVQHSGTLHFRAPKSAGVYRLYVYAAGHAAECTVVVA